MLYYCQKKTQLFWQKAEPLNFKINCIKSQDEGDYPEIRYLELKKETGLQLFLRKVHNKSLVYLQIHPACCDGQGRLLLLKRPCLLHNQVR